MRIKNIDQILSEVDSDAGKLLILYLSNVLVSSAEEIAEELNWNLGKTLKVCQSLTNKNVLTKIEPNQYALSRAVISDVH